MKNGIYEDLSIEAYHENKTHFSATQLKKAKRSLKEFKYDLDDETEQERKSHFDFGNAFEMALCNGIDKILDYVVVLDIEDRPELDKGITSKLNQAWKKEILNGPKLVVAKDGKESLETLKLMVESCLENPTIVSFLQNTYYQKSCFWTDKETGLNLKTRPDITQVERSIVVDIKTTLDGSPQKFSRDASNLDYFVQAVSQIDGVINSGLMPSVDNYFYLVVEKVAPYNATIYEIDVEDLIWLNDSYEYLKDKVAKAMKSGEFKGYDYNSDNKYGIMRMDIPLYYKNTF